jgi:hypothetical protein
MKTTLHIYIIAIWLLITPTFATNSFTSLPSIPEHPSKTGFHLPFTESAQLGGVRNLAVESKQQLDSIVVAGKEKFVYQYTGSNLTTMLTYYAWNGNSWLASIQVALFYNESGKLVETVNYEWNSFSSTWLAKWKTLYTYNSNGQTLSEQYITYDNATQKWVNTTRYAYTYTPAGTITKRTHAYWSALTNTWVVDWTTDYVYNLKNQRIADVSYSEGYVPASKTEYIFNSNGVLIRKNEFYSNPSTNRWEATAKEEYLLDNQQRPVVRTYAYWNTVKQAWENVSKSNVEFDNNGNSLSVINYRWNVEHLSWDIIDKQEAQIDVNGNVAALSYFDWNPAIKNWKYRSKHYWSYKNDVTINQLVLPYSYTNFTNSRYQVLSLRSYYNNNNVDEIVDQTYYYSTTGNHTQVAENSADKNIVVYPNPTSDYIIVEGIDVNNIAFFIYDSKGAIITETSFKDGFGEVSISQLTPGIYLYVATINNERLVGKFVKK